MTPSTQDARATGLVELAEEIYLPWVRTLLTVLATEPQRIAFINGYNGQPIPPNPSPEMRRKWHEGQDAFRHIERIRALAASTKDQNDDG
jgi:hypothetical protein